MLKSKEHNYLSSLITYTLFGVILSVFVITACDDSPTDANDDEPGLSVSASFSIDPAEPEAGEQVTLDGSESTVDGADELQFEWSLSAPDGSDAAIDNPAAEVTHFDADIGETYEVSLVVSAEDAEDSESQEIDVQEAEVQEITEDITEDRTLESHILYIVTDEINVEATLTIEPGTVVEFEQGTGLILPSTAGAILADGTEEEPILLTATSDQPGWWNGIYLEESSNINNQLDWVTVEYGGGEEYRRSGSGNVIVGRDIRDASAIEITNSTLQHSGSYGLWLHSDSDMPEFENNLLTENNDAPVSIPSNNTAQLNSTSSFSGNDEDYIAVRGGYEIDGENVTWDNLDADYRLSSSEVQIENGATLTINPGTTLEFENGGGLELQTEGGINADGTEDEPILFTGTNEQPGWWNGIYIDESSNSNNRLNWVTVEYGGGEEFRRSGSGNVIVGRDIRDESAIDITNSTLQFSGSYGLWVHTEADLSEFSDNMITDNNDAPVNIASNNAHLLDVNSTYSGNEESYVYIRSDYEIESDNVTWETLDVDYRMGSNTLQITDNATLTITPGVTLMIESGGRIELNSDGGFAADGTQDEQILITGITEQPGSWDGIYIEESSNPSNELNWVTIEYGGGEEYRRSGSGNIVVGRDIRDPSSIDITNSTIRDSNSYGLWVHSDSDVNEDACDENTFTSNGDDDCMIN